MTRAAIQRLLFAWGLAVASLRGHSDAKSQCGARPELATESALWNDYKIGVDLFKLLADIRFKLLAFVPAISGAAIVFLSRDFATTNQNSVLVLIVGLLGFVVTLGVVFYDQRNSQISNATFYRLQWLEERLGISGRGQFSTRPKRSLFMFGLWKVWHDRGLALIYGSVLGAWFFPIVHSGLSIAKIDAIGGVTRDGASAASAVLLAVICIFEVHRLDRCATADKPTLS